jgi:cell division protein FtsB
MPRRLLLVLLALVVPGLAAAQGLGDVAARERQKRAAAGPRAKPRVLSNDDLRKDEAGKAASEATAASPESSSDSPSAPGSESAPESEEAAAQRGRLEQAQAEVDSTRAAVMAAEARVKDLGDKLNPMSTSFIYGAGGSNDANEELRVRQALQQAEGELGQARDALVRANRSYEDVRQGRPAGSSEPR